MSSVLAKTCVQHILLMVLVPFSVLLSMKTQSPCFISLQFNNHVDWCTGMHHNSITVLSLLLRTEMPRPPSHWRVVSVSTVQSAQYVILAQGSTTCAVTEMPLVHTALHILLSSHVLVHSVTLNGVANNKIYAPSHIQMYQHSAKQILKCLTSTGQMST